MTVFRASQTATGLTGRANGNKRDFECQNSKRHFTTRKVVLPTRLTTVFCSTAAFFLNSIALKPTCLVMVFGGCDVCTCGLGKCAGGTQFSVHWTWAINLLIQIIFAAIQYATSWKYILLVATVWGPACLLALFFHELGHIGATRCQRGTHTYSMLW